MGNEVSLCKDDIQGGLAAVEARLRAGANVNKRMVFQQDTAPLPKGCKCTPLGFAILSWDLQLLDVLITAGADLAKPVGLPLRFDFTPLQLAVALGFPAAVGRLLERGADPNPPLQLKRGTTAPPFRQEVRHGRGSANPQPNAGNVSPTAPLLLQLDTLPHLRAGDTALHVAIDCTEEYGFTPSASTVGCSRIEVVETLICHPRTDLNRLNGRRRPPLYKACKRRLALVATLLATHPRVDVNAGWPLFAAIKAESGDLVRVLLQAGAGPTCTVVDAQGHTALSYALRGHATSETFHDRADVVAMLVQGGSRVDPEMLSYAEERNWHSVVVALQLGTTTAGLADDHPAAAGVAAGSGGGGGQVLAAATAAGFRERAAWFNHVSVESGAARSYALPALSLGHFARLRRGSGHSGGANRSEGSRGHGGRGGGGSTSVNGGAGDRAGGAIGDGMPGAGNGGASGHQPNGATASGTVRHVAPTPSSSSSRPATAVAAAPRTTGPTHSWLLSPSGSSPAPSQPRPSTLEGAVRRNPLLILFPPLLILVALIDAFAAGMAAIAEFFRVLLIVLACMAIFVTPAALYGLYRVVRWLAWLLHRVVGRSAASVLHGSGAGELGLASMRSTGAAETHVPLPPTIEPFSTADASTLDVDVAGSNLPAAVAATATTSSAAVAGSIHRAAEEGSQALLSKVAGALGNSNATAANVNATVAATTATSAMTAAAGHCSSADGGVGVGAGVGSPDAVSSRSVLGSVLRPRLLVVLWRAYLDIFVAIGAVFCALIVVRLLFEGAEEALLGLGIRDRTRLGACLRARAVYRRSRGRCGGGSPVNDDGKGTLTGVLLVIALALRLFGGVSFWSLWGASTFVWAIVEGTDLVMDYSRELRTGQHAGGSSDRRDQRHRSIVGAAAGEHDRQGTPGNAVLQQPGMGGSGAVLSCDAAAAAASGAAEARTGGCDCGSSSEFTGGLEGRCCVCMSSRAVMGFVHRDVVHCCMCVGCEATLRRRGSIAKCLICKRPANAVARVIAT